MSLPSSPNRTWEVPEPLSTHDVRVDDETVITLRRHGNPSGPRLVLSHGNGLSIDLYYPFWSLLEDDFDLVAYDLRNHGWNPATSMRNHNVPTLVHDHDVIMEAIDIRFGDKPKVGVFHSVSALTTLLSLNLGANFAALVLFDPPLAKPGRSHHEYEEVAKRLSAMTRSRTPLFKTRETFSELLSYLPNFQKMQSGVRDLFAETTLRKSPERDGFELRCPREYEAQMVMYASPYAVLVDFDSLVCATKVIGADPTLPYSYLPTLDLRDVFTVNYDFLPEATHLLQLEQPEECAALVREFLEEVGHV